MCPSIQFSSHWRYCTFFIGTLNVLSLSLYHGNIVKCFCSLLAPSDTPDKMHHRMNRVLFSSNYQTHSHLYLSTDILRPTSIMAIIWNYPVVYYFLNSIAITLPIAINPGKTHPPRYKLRICQFSYLDGYTARQASHQGTVHQDQNYAQSFYISAHYPKPSIPKPNKSIYSS